MPICRNSVSCHRIRLVSMVVPIDCGDNEYVQERKERIIFCKPKHYKHNMLYIERLPHCNRTSEKWRP